jgi:vitamin B12 transporter
VAIRRSTARPLSSALILETEDLAPEDLTSLSLMSVGVGAARTQRWDNTSLSVSADYTDLSPYMELIPQNIEWNRAPHTAGGQVIFRHEFQPGSLLKVQAQHHQSRLALRAPNPQALTESLPVNLQNSYTYTNASWQTVLAEDWALFVGGGYTRNLDHTRTIADITTSQESMQAKVRLSRSFGQDHFLRFGAEGWKERFAEQWQAAEADDQQAIRPYYGAAFAEADWRISDKWVGRTGLRWEASTAIRRARLSPRASLAYQTGRSSQLSVSTGRFVQSPEAEWLFQQEDLQFEEAAHYLLNWQWQKSGRTFRAEVFRKTYDQLVTSEAGTISNSGDGYAQGVELFYRDRVSIKNTDFWLSYSWLDTKRKYRDFQFGPPLPLPRPTAFRPSTSTGFRATICSWVPPLPTAVHGFLITPTAPSSMMGARQLFGTSASTSAI